MAWEDPAAPRQYSYPESLTRGTWWDTGDSCRLKDCCGIAGRRCCARAESNLAFHPRVRLEAVWSRGAWVIRCCTHPQAALAPPSMSVTA